MISALARWWAFTSVVLQQVITGWSGGALNAEDDKVFINK